MVVSKLLFQNNIVSVYVNKYIVDTDESRYLRTSHVSDFINNRPGDSFVNDRGRHLSRSCKLFWKWTQLTPKEDTIVPSENLSKGYLQFLVSLGQEFVLRLHETVQPQDNMKWRHTSIGSRGFLVRDTGSRDFLSINSHYILWFIRSLTTICTSYQTGCWCWGLEPVHE